MFGHLFFVLGWWRLLVSVVVGGICLGGNTVLARFRVVGLVMS